jgi:hypothetical protein
MCTFCFRCLLPVDTEVRTADEVQTRKDACLPGSQKWAAKERSGARLAEAPLCGRGPERL